MRQLARALALALALQTHTASAANIQPPIFTTQFPLIFEQLKKEAERDIQKLGENAEEMLKPLRSAVDETVHGLETNVKVAARVVDETVHDLEKNLQHVVDDTDFLLQSGRKLIEGTQENFFYRLRERLGSTLSWRKAGRLMRNNNVEDMTGEWSLAEKHGMDTFLKELGFNLVQRTAVLSAGQVQVITRRAGSLHIVTRDIRGTSELVLPLDGPSVTGEGDGNLPVARRAFVDRGGEIVITETLADAPPNSEPLSVCRRSLQEDGRLCVDVQKRTKGGQMAQMRIVFSPVGSRDDDEEQQQKGGSSTAATEPQA